jgi:hypothetical protein
MSNEHNYYFRTEGSCDKVHVRLCSEVTNTQVKRFKRSDDNHYI